MKPPPACVVCAATSWRGPVRHAGGAYLQCAACGLAEHVPSGEGAGDGSADDDGEPPNPDGVHPHPDAAARADAVRRLALLADVGALRGTVVDVACGAGAFVEAARARGWRPVGVDARPWARAATERHTGAPVFFSLAAILASDLGPVDVVTFAALERADQPDQAVADAWSVLRPGGLLVIEAWDRESAAARLLGAHWPPTAPPSLCYLFSRATLPRLVVRAGFERAKVRVTGRRVSVGHLARTLAARTPSLRGALTRLVLETRLAELVVTYQCGDILSVAARKPRARG